MPAENSPTASQPLGLLASIWKSGLVRFLPFVFIYVLGVAVLFPIVPTIQTNGFASAAIGHVIDCQEFTPETAPQECVEAHAQAVTWGSWTSFVSGSILSFLCSPVVGHLSDHWGRRPFMLVGIGIAIGPMVVIMFNLWGWLSIFWYYPFQALNGIVSSFSMVLTCVADVMEPRHRAAAAAFVLAMFSIGLIIGPIVGGIISPDQAVYVCISLTVCAALYVLLFVPETAPRKCRAIDRVLSMRAGSIFNASGNGAEARTRYQKVASDGASSSGQHNSEGKVDDAVEESGTPTSASDTSTDVGRMTMLASLTNGWRILASSSWYMKLALIWALFSAMSSGAQDTLLQYLQLTLGFTTHDQAELLVVMASCSLAVKVTVLGLLIRFLGDQWVVVFGLVAYVIEFLLLAAAHTKATSIAAVAVGAFAAVAWPAFIALQSSRANADDWGAVAGMLQAVGSLASGTGPLLFAAIFSRTSVGGPGSANFHPELVWYLGSILGGIAAILTACIYVGENAPVPIVSRRGNGDGDHASGQSSSPVAAVAGGAGNSLRNDDKPDPHDPWVLNRTVDLQSSLERLRSFKTHAMHKTNEDRGNQHRDAGSEARPLLPGQPHK
mmetsp:Transcript_39772/g.118374  ORF Transcript_39772/g.118374 Transcript_39772/m.118374 type:complete len:610 (-) Transcript_39772:1609-3438(-)